MQYNIYTDLVQVLPCDFSPYSKNFEITFPESRRSLRYIMRTFSRWLYLGIILGLRIGLTGFKYLFRLDHH